MTQMTQNGPARGGGLAAVIAIGALVASCEERRDPIVVQQTTVTVENQTRREWTAVEIWVNDQYRATMPTLAAGGRLVVPLNGFVAGFGQRFDRFRQPVYGVEVVAKSGGDDVRLTWGKGRRR
jgi:hypothetical protein